jgi:hypothetical protein
MNTERLFNIVMAELSIDKLKLESELEDAINSKEQSIDVKVITIKNILAKISAIENSIAKFSSLINNNNNNNQKEK